MTALSEVFAAFRQKRGGVKLMKRHFFSVLTRIWPLQVGREQIEDTDHASP